MNTIEQQVDVFEIELKRADSDAYLQWVTLTYTIPDRHPALFYIDTGKIDIEFVKHKLLNMTEAEEIELYTSPDYVMEVVNPKVYLEKLNVPVYLDEKEGKQLVMVPFVLTEYCINFTDYRDGIGGYLKTEFIDGCKKITGWVDYGSEWKVNNLKRLLAEFGAKEISLG